MKKLLCVLLAVTAACVLSACSDSENNNNTNTVKNSNISSVSEETDLAALKSKMISELSVKDSIDLDSESLLSLYGIAAEDIEESACYTTMDGVFPEEVVMIKAKDSEAVKRITEKLNTRVEDVKVQSQNYDAENYALAQKCSVISRGNYVAMFLSPHYDELVKLFNEGVK